MKGRARVSEWPVEQAVALMNQTPARKARIEGRFPQGLSARPLATPPLLTCSDNTGRCKSGQMVAGRRECSSNFSRSKSGRKWLAARLPTRSSQTGPTLKTLSSVPLRLWRKLIAVEAALWRPAYWMQNAATHAAGEQIEGA